MKDWFLARYHKSRVVVRLILNRPVFVMGGAVVRVVDRRLAVELPTKAPVICFKCDFEGGGVEVIAPEGVLRYGAPTMLRITTLGRTDRAGTSGYDEGDTDG